MEMEKLVLTIITHSGEAKNLLMKGIKAAREDNLRLARQFVDEAEEMLSEAHKKQSELIRQEALGKDVQPSILLIHGQDHLMTTMMLKDMAEELIELYSRVNSRQRVNGRQKEKTP